MTAATQLDLDEETTLALDVARGLVKAGAPIFLARPALDATGRWVPDGGHGTTGYLLPGRWQHTMADPSVIDDWRPGMAVCMVTGVVLDGVDVDPRHGGDQSAAEMAAAGAWPRSLGRQITPSGGWHDLVNPLRVRSRDDVLPGLDVKAGHGGDGHGFLFLAPTVKLSKSTGELGNYRWTQAPMLDELDSGDDSGHTLAARIAALRAAEDAEDTEVPHDAWDAMSTARQDAVGRYLAGVVRCTGDEMAEVAQWPVGFRDDRQRGWQKVVADVSNRFGRLARADWTDWTYTTAWQQLDGIIPAPIAAAVGLGATWQAQRGRRTPAPYPATLATPDAATQWLHSMSPATTRDATGQVAEGLSEQQDDPGERARQLFPRLDWHALWGDDSEEEWIHEPLLPARRSVVIYSPPKAGKSLLMLELAVAISRGETFLGYTPSRRWRVLYVDFENDPRGDVRSRLQAMGYGPDDLDHVDYLSFPRMAGLDTERGSLELLEAVSAYGSEVVVIDTVSRAVDGEENSNDTWLGLYRHTGLKLKRAGVAAVRLDHTGKDESKGQRGGSAKSGDVDAIWRLTKITDTRFRLECTESRLQIATKSLQLTRHQIPRLHHTVEVLGAMTDHDAKVTHLVELCTSNSVPVDANREAVRTFAATRGIKASGRVVQDVIRRRKGELSPEFTPPPAHLNDDESSPSSAPPGNGDSEHGTGELLARVHLSSPPSGNPELSAAVRSTAEKFTSFTPQEEHCTECGSGLAEMRVDYGKSTCVDCERRAAS